MISPKSFAVVCGLCLASASVTAADGQVLYEAAVASVDRPAADRNRDKSRHPVEILAFMELGPGMTAVEFGAGGGYTTELIARVVGPEGRVYAQALDASRTRGDRLPNVVALDKHLLWEARDTLHDAGLADGQADRVLIFFALHDMYLNDRIDKQRLYRDILALLKPGGYLIVLDNAAEVGSGVRDTSSTHRIGEQFVRDQIEKAGFAFSGATDVLRNPEDKLDEPWNRPAPYRQPGFQDRFAYRFAKP